MFLHSGAFIAEAARRRSRRRPLVRGAIEIRLRRRPFAGERADT